MKPTVMLKVRITIEGRNEAIHGFPGHLGAGAGGSVAAAPGPAQAGPPQEKYVIVNSHNGDSLLDWFWIDELEGIIGSVRPMWSAV